MFRYFKKGCFEKDSDGYGDGEEVHFADTHKVDPPKKKKWQTKKCIKLRRRGKPQTRGTHPRHLNVKASTTNLTRFLGDPKKHETVKVFCKPCKPGQVHEYAEEISRLSGRIPIQIIRDDTIIFYRGKNYLQPEIMSPIDTLSKKRALEKSKYEQSLESFIAMAEKELELYYRHLALYGDPNLGRFNNGNSICRK
ncbi:hypothetical protein Dsin_018454 [Dipteronia sinensis]|uniref:CRM domain-containing protein n=1 Tax=Dipteronia sinensis TaxID=43782 RepID=A0AAE0A6S6_9ROSI|nr:hypothetical protein Dsin_018454 [Dipteronia sinensis]